MSTTVYILQCANGQYYVGSTTSLIKRIGEHQQADSVLYRGAKFTKAHQPVELVSYILYKFPTCLKIRGVLKREAILPQQFHNNFNFCES